MHYYRQKNLNTSKEVPMVIVLHGCLQSAEAVKGISGWNKMADFNSLKMN
jgi:poly(3-hydroxybutyrate) depolymerase